MAPSTPPTVYVTPDDHSAWLIVVSVILLIWMVLTLGLRVAIRTRFNGPWSWDDTFVAIASGAAIVQCAMIYSAIHNGLGKRMHLISDQSLTLLEKYVYISQIFYVLAVGLSKVSTSWLISRLTRTKRHIWTAHAVTMFAGAWTIVSMFVISIRCSVKDPWDLTGRQCAADPYQRWLAIEVVFAAIEMILFGLSIYLVWGLQMARHLKFVVVGAFICRIFVIVTIGVRLWYLRPVYFLSDATFDSVMAGILTQVCMHYSIMAATIPCTRPFIKAFHGYLDNEDIATSGWSNAGKSGDHSGYMLHSVSSGRSGKDARASRPTVTVDSVMASNAAQSPLSPNSPWSPAKSDASPTATKLGAGSFGLQTDPNARTFYNGSTESNQSTGGTNGATNLQAMLRPDFGEVITTVEHDPHAVDGNARTGPSQRSRSASETSDKMIIKQTRDWVVTYERTH